MIYEIKGKVEEVCKTQTFASGFAKRNIVVNAAEEGSKYPNVLSFSVTKDKCSTLDGFAKGDEVSIKFAIDGRTWDGPKGRSYFTDLKIMKIEKVGSASSTKSDPVPESVNDYGDDPDAMPF